MPKPKVQITEIKWRLNGTHASYLCGVLDRTHDSIILLYELDRDWTVGDGQMVLPKGTLTLGYFWADRHYNVYHWIAPDTHTTLGTYINVSNRPIIRAERIEWTDWIIDILISPILGTLILDEEELQELDEAHHSLIPKIYQIRDQILQNQSAIFNEIEITSQSLIANL